MERRFGSTAPYTVGAEEELQLVDPSSRELAQAAEAALAAPDGSVKTARNLVARPRPVSQGLRREAELEKPGSLENVVEHPIQTTPE